MLQLPTKEDADRLRDFLVAADYTQQHFENTPVLRELPVRSGAGHVFIERTEEPSALSVLVRWFFGGRPQSGTHVRQFIPDPILRILSDCGMVRCEAGEFIPNIMLTPCDGRYFAADPAARMNSPESSDAVLWPNPSTRLLQYFSVQRYSSHTLDLGAGCGILGILAAPYSGKITSTDLNPCAAEFTQFNACLNGIDSIECLTGDTFEPVAGRRFDLILANPPFFVTPMSGDMYCESGMELDNYCRRVVREAAGQLNEDGFFQAVVEWVQVAGQPWQDRIAGWTEASGCDAWVLRTYVRDAAGYARERIRETFPFANYSEQLGLWMDYYRKHQVEEIHGGVMAMRRRAGSNWLRLEDAPVAATRSFGDLVLDTFDTQDVLHSRPSDAALLAMRPRLGERAELDEVYRIEAGRWSRASLHLRIGGAVPSHCAVEREVAGFLVGCDGSRTLAELAAELADRLSVDPDSVRAQCCSVIRTLAARRILYLSTL
jgi:methylase of polypeptide subunit release factors